MCSCSLEQMDFCTEGKVTNRQKDREGKRERKREITKSMPGCQPKWMKAENASERIIAGWLPNRLCNLGKIVAYVGGFYCFWGAGSRLCTLVAHLAGALMQCPSAGPGRLHSHTPTHSRNLT